MSAAPARAVERLALALFVHSEILRMGAERLLIGTDNAAPCVTESECRIAALPSGAVPLDAIGGDFLERTVGSPTGTVAGTEK